MRQTVKPFPKKGFTFAPYFQTTLFLTIKSKTTMRKLTKLLLTLAMLSGVVGGGNSGKAETVVTKTPVILTGGVDGCNPAPTCYGIQMTGWQNFVAYEDADGVAFDETSTMVFNLKEAVNNGQVRVTFTFSDGTTQEAWWCLGIGNSAEDNTSYYGHAFDGSTYYLKKGLGDSFESKKSLKITKVIVQNFNYSTDETPLVTYDVIGGTICGVPMTIKQGNATTFGYYGGVFSPTAAQKNIFKMSPFEVGDYQKLVIKFGASTPGGWAIVTASGYPPNLPTGITEHEISLDGNNLSEFSIFNWNANPDPINISEVYLYKEEGSNVVDQNVEITIGGETRNYQLYVPGTVQTNCPLVLSLHGAGGQSTDYSPFSKGVADEAGCIVAYPQGKTINFSVIGTTNTGWEAYGEDNADVAFLKAVIEDVSSKYQIDRKRIYCCGFSNGGMMTYAMSNVCSDEIAAFASISGYPINEFHLRHTGARPVPFLHIHGKADDFVLYAKMPTIVDEMVARLGANPVPTTTTGSGYTKSVYAAAEGSFPYVYYEIDGMGHNDYTASTEDGNSAKTIWNFFNQYTLESPCDETLKWAPRIDENGYNPAEHGWTKNSDTTLLQFGGDQYTSANKNVYHSLQFNSGNYKLCFKSTGAEGKTVGVKIEKLTSPNTAVLNTTVNVGEDAELPFSVTDGWGEYKLTMTRPSASDAISITDLVITQTDNTTPVASNHYRLYAKSFSTGGTNITYADGKLKWTSTGNNVAGAITAEAGVIAKFSSIHFTCSGLTEGATYRVMLTTAEGTNYISEINTTGDVTVNFSDLIKQWGSETLTPEILETVTQVRIGGGTGGSPSTESPYEMMMDVSSFYIESEEDRLSVASTSDWVVFSKMVNAGVAPLDAVLTADVDAGSTMVGTSTNPYQGTFDGAGHTLTFNYDGTEQFAAPFQYVNASTISDLRTTGSIKTTNNQCGGVIGKNAGGNTTLNRCMSSATIESKTSGNGRAGGLAGRCTDGTLTFNYCMYDGEITCYGAQGASGFVGYCSDISTMITINNCLVAVASDQKSGDDQNFVGGFNGSNEVYTNAYFLDKFGSSGQGTQLTDQLRYSGQAAYTLNQDISDGAWFFGQGGLNSSRVDSYPTLTSDASKKVYKASNEALYANADGLLPDPALSKKLAWKMAMTWDPIYFVTLPAASASNFNLYGSSDSYILKVSAAGATTLVVPFNVAEANIPSDVKVYNLTFDGTDITAIRVNSITANQPVLINAPEGEYRLESSISYDTNIDFSEYGTPTNGALTGVYNTSIPFSYVSQDAYVLQNGEDGLGFYKVEAANSIKITSFRAYLTANTSARSLRIVFSDETAINDVKNVKSEETCIYNLSGQRVEKVAKGLYIKNGKKVLVK